MKNYSVLKIAPAFLLAGAMLQAQKVDSTKTKSIDEVVLIGYGKKKKSDLTGSVTSISSKDFNDGMLSSPEQLIQGKAAGVQITTNGGAPGSGSTIRVRSGASLNASNDPLIVIDGMPLDTKGIDGAANPLALINPNDIESFNILKDASAAAIYGNRASNGVIIITTKKGTRGKLRVGYNSTTSVSQRFGTVNMMDANEFRTLVKDKASADYISKLGNANTNWQEAFYQLATGFDNNLTLSGGIGKVPFRLSLGYLNQDGIIRTNNIERSTAGLNLNPKLFNNHLDINFNLKGTYVENRFTDGEAINAAIAFDPTQNIYDASNKAMGGYWEWMDNGIPNQNATRNPLSMLYQRRDVSYVKRLLGNVQFDYKFHFLPELRANLNLGLDLSNSNGTVTTLPTLASAYFQKGTNRNYEQEKKNRLLEFYLNYSKKLPSIESDIDVMAGYSYQKWNETKPFAPTIYGDGTKDPASGVDFFTQNLLLSYYTRLNYTFKNRYLLTASVRRDGSSRFNSNNRWGYFPSVSLAWRIDQENILKGNTTISTFKLRGGWGVTGQQDISGDYPYLAVYSISNSGANYLFGGVPYTLYRPEGYDPNIRWETTRTTNIGLDFGILKDRLLFNVDAYKRYTVDLLSEAPTPGGANFTNLLLSNIGNMESKGLEIGALWKAIQNENFSWDISANATFQDAKITNLAANEGAGQRVLVGGISGITGGLIQTHSVGYRPNSFYVYQQKYDASGRPIEGEYVDRNGDGIINEQDLYEYQSSMPKALFAFTSRMTYKNWDMGFALRASLGNYVYNNANARYGNLQNIGTNGYLQNVTRDYLNTGFTKAQYFSDYYVENASFLRMDNINIGYNFPQFIGNARLRVNASVNNVFVVTKYSGVDPEVFNGVDNNFYQRPRVYSLGFNLQF
ncbi:SusC/RagA family TonB-linked outer membrane protein [Riemerella anatipestifer]|uniref:SusC/RagA family TonB-linked outer membrane protein n=1 Tax=Riemerella anatipestifer TaxID=34085 RepID=UPI0021F8C25D|nr:SusC/RagA family TonB-linked outer membrane protein [Riemerella anatipestifer]MCW0485159.1 SusC/RagA family TonB-linked outer membrane protein [Riemerella anatipestifer]